MDASERSGTERYILCVRWPPRIENVAIGIVVGHPSSKQETDRINSQENAAKHRSSGGGGVAGSVVFYFIFLVTALLV